MLDSASGLCGEHVRFVYVNVCVDFSPPPTMQHIDLVALARSMLFGFRMYIAAYCPVVDDNRVVQFLLFPQKGHGGRRQLPVSIWRGLHSTAWFMDGDPRARDGLCCSCGCIARCVVLRVFGERDM